MMERFLLASALAVGSSALTAPLSSMRPARAHHVSMLVDDGHHDQQPTPLNTAFVRRRLERSLAITERVEKIDKVESVAAVASAWTERQRVRFSFMILSTEPLPHEIFGLQALFGTVGATVYGMVGFLLGAFQLAPIASWAPGRCGEMLRSAGWGSFTALRSAALRMQKVWQQLRRWDEATGTSAMMLAMLVAVRQQGVTMKRGAALRLAGATG